MKKETPTGLFDVLESTAIATAIVRTYADFERDGLKPGSDKWTRPNRYNTKMFEEVVSAWSDITGIEDWHFPLSVAAVSSLWIDWRKTPDRMKTTWRGYLDARHGNEVVAAQ
jgi:hypothetical protein